MTKMMVRKTGDWKGVEQKYRGLNKEISTGVNDVLKVVTTDYQKELQTMIQRNHVEPDGGVPFTSLQLSDNIKIYPEKVTRSPGKAAFVGLSEDAPEEMQDFAVGAEYEKDAFIGLWRTTTFRYLGKLQKLAENMLTKITTIKGK